MPKIVGVRERRHQPYYDTLIRADYESNPFPNVAQSTQLFNGVNLGLEFWTNMSIAGAFASDNSYIALALRCYVQYIGPYAEIMYALTMQQLFLNFTVADKPQFSGPAWYFPQGGGVWGLANTPAAEATATNTMFGTNGTPQTDAILKFAKPIPIPARQHLKVVANLYDAGSSGNGTSLRTAYFNQANFGGPEGPAIGHREIKVVIDGLHTRDVL
jgi:hypothetical protein